MARLDVRLNMTMLAVGSLFLANMATAQPIFCSGFESCVPGTTDPVIATLSPANGSDDVSVTQILVVTFSQPMDNATINDRTILLEESGGIPVVGLIAHEEQGSRVATFAAVEELHFDTAYTLKVLSGETGVISQDGNLLPGDETAEFQTSAPNDSVMVPTGQTPTTSLVEILFERPLDPATVSDGSIWLFDVTDGHAVNANFAWDPDTRAVSITPIPKLLNTHEYEVTVETSLRDHLGNPYPVQTVWSFTASGSDNIGPAVIIGRNGDQGHGLYYLEADDPLMITSISADSVLFTDKNESPMPFVLTSYDTATDRAYLRPVQYLRSALSPYEVAITPAVTDLSRNSAAPDAAVFVIETVAPSVVAVDPADLDVDVPPDTVITVIFDEPMDESSVTASSEGSPGTLRLLDDASSEVPGTIAHDVTGAQWTFIPGAALARWDQVTPCPTKGCYTLVVGTEVTDTAGNALDSEFSSTFTVAD